MLNMDMLNVTTKELHTFRIDWLKRIEANMVALDRFTENQFELVRHIKNDMDYLYQSHSSADSEDFPSDEDMFEIKERLRQLSMLIVINYELLDEIPADNPVLC